MADASERYGYSEAIRGGADRPFELTDTSITEGAFFQLDSPATIDFANRLGAPSTMDDDSVVESTTPTHQRDLKSLESLESGGGLEMMKPRPEIILRWKRFGAALLVSVLLVAGLTVWFWVGIRINTIKEPVGDSTESEKLLRQYNTYSGAAMGIFEAFLGLGFANFFPAFTVYVHNLKWWPGDDPTVKASKVKKMLLLLFFPLMMIAVGNSFSALQAGSSTLRLDVIMSSTTLGHDSSNYTLPNLTDVEKYVIFHEETILKTAVLRQSTPFQYVESRCERKVQTQDEITEPALKRMADIDSTAAVFGFPLKDWSREMYPSQSAKFSEDALDLDTSFELLFQGQAFLERSVGGLPTQRCRYFAANDTYPCATRKKKSTYLDQLYGYFDGTKQKTAEALKKEIISGMQSVFFNDLDEDNLSEVQFLTFNISEQIKVQYMVFPMWLKPDFEYGLPGDTEVLPKGCEGSDCEYRYKLLDSDAFCGGSSCIFPDWQADVIPKKQASMMQYKKNCQQKSMTFDDNLQTFIPGGCQDEENAVFFSGFGSQVFVESFGMMDSSKTSTNDLPYALNPKRAVALTLGKLVWSYDNLTDPFGANCLDTTSDCIGLKQQLRPSGRYVLMGKNRLPTKIAKSDFRRPINLFQLTAPAIMSPRGNRSLTVLEYLGENSFYGTNATTSVTLAIGKCSVLADAYINHIRSNVYVLFSAYQPMYMSALLYIFQNAAVTKIRQTREFDATSSTRFTGDRIMSKILIQNTDVGVYTVWIGCIVLVILAFVTLMFPNERARLSPMMGKNARAERFVAVQTEEVYPNLVYMKRFRIGKTGESIKLSEFSVESVSLHHKMEEDEQVFL